MPNSLRSTPLRYGAALAAVALATAARRLLDPLLDDLYPFTTLFLAVLVVAGYAGRGPGLAATALGALAAAQFLLVGGDEALGLSPEGRAGLFLFAAVGSGIALLGGSLRAAWLGASEQAEEAGRQRERLRVTLASVGDAVLVCDASGRITSLNPVAEALTGWTLAEALGRPMAEVFRIVNVETRQAEENPAERAMSEGVVVALANHTVLIARDGAERPIDDSAGPIRGPDGRVDGAILVFRDVTARYQQDARLREQVRRSRSILESIFDGYYALGRDWRFAYVNPQAERILGREAGELDGQLIWEAYPGLIGSEIAAAYHRAMDDRVASALTAHDPDHDRWYEVHAHPIPEGISVYFRDLTDRKRSEARERALAAEAAEAHARFRAFFDQGALFAGIMAVDGTLLEANRLALEDCGYARDQVIGRPLWEGPWWGPSPELAGEIRRAVDVAAAGQTFRAELPYFVASGEERVVDLIVLPTKDEAGRVLFLAPTGIDVTDRKRAEAALRQTEGRFRRMADAMPQIAWITRSGRPVEFLNERWFQYTGMSPAFAYSPDGWKAAIHPEDLRSIARASAQAAASGTPFEAEYRVRRHDGAYRWHLGRSVEIPDEDGQALHEFGTATDIDDRKRAERDALFLAEAGATLAAIVDEASTLEKVAHLAVPAFADWCSVDLVDEDGMPLRLAVAHVDPEKVALAHDLQRRYPPRPDAPNGVFQVIRTGEPIFIPEISDELLAANADDPEHLRILRELGLQSYLCVPLKGRDGTLGAISFVAAESARRYDEPDLRLAEDLAARAVIALDNARLYREARDSEGRFRQLADAMPQIVWTARPDGHLDYYNRRWYEFTGRPEGEEGDQSWTPILHPDDVRPCLELWRASVESGRPYEIEYRFCDRAGDYRWQLGRALPIRDEAGRVVRWFGTATDIDDRKRAEGALRAARDEAEEANRAKNQFLAVLSHELRTPLNPILLAASSMLDRPAEPEEIRPNLEMIRRNVHLQARLIDDLLDVMRIVRGKMPLHWEVADAHSLIEHAAQICRGEIQDHRLDLVLDLAARRHHVSADPARLQQVFWNLIKNAVKFTPEGGSIAIRSANRPGPEGRGERLAFEIADTGIGIEPEALSRIFDPFQQGETTITRRFGGLGLGLAICKGVVEAHGGSIEVESPGPGRGATFRIALDALPEAAAGPDGESGEYPDFRTPEPADGRPGSLRVLVVEDEPTTLRLMARLIRGLGHAVTTAATIASALEAFDAAEFDLIVSDIGLPDGTGLDLMRQAVARRGPVPAIALTGYGMEEDIARSRQAGFAAHMTKPIDFTRLEAAIREVADH